MLETEKQLQPASLYPTELRADEARVSDDIDSDGVPLSHYWHVILQYKWSILGLALIGGIVGGLQALKAVPIYRAETRLLVEYEQPSIPAVQQFQLQPNHWLYFETQRDIVRSRAVASRALEILGLDRQPEPESAPAVDTPTTEPGLFAQIRDALSNWQDWLPEEWRAPPSPPPRPDAYRAGLVAGIQGGLTVTGGQETQILDISFESPDPAHAARVVDAVAQAYIEFGLESRLTSVQQNSSWLGGRIGELQEKLAESEEALRAFKARESMLDTARHDQVVGAELSYLMSSLAQARTKAGETQTRYEQIRRFSGDGQASEGLASLVESPLVREAHLQRLSMERQVAELEERYGEKHPKMIKARADLRAAERRLGSEVDKAVAAARKEYEIAAAQEAELRRRVDKHQERMRALSKKTSELEKLEREVSANRELYDTFLARFKAADVAEQYDVANVRVIDRAEVPSTPVKPDKRRMVTTAMVVGVFLGLLLAFLRDYLDNTFRHRQDVEERLRLPVLGIVPRVRLGFRKGEDISRYPVRRPQSTFAEAVNDIRTAVLFSHVDDPAKVVLVTSPSAGEGKTTLASSLARAFGVRGRTLLLEGDLRRGVLAGSGRGRDHQQGLADVVSGACTLNDALQQDSDVERLYLLTAGTPPPNPLEILSSRRFGALMDSLRKSFDYIVVDSSPVLPVSDALVLGHVADSVILTVRANKTTYQAGQEAVRRLASARIRPIGVVLQQVDVRRLKRYAYAYTGYYGQGYSMPERVVSDS